MLLAALLVGGAACATGNGVDNGVDPVDDAGFDKEDTGELEDRYFPKDTGNPTEDAGEADAGEMDTGVVDPPDVGVDSGARDVPVADVGTRDAGALDTGPRDVGTPDTGPRDTGVIDSGPRDVGTPDTGPRDTGAIDTGPVDTGPRDTGTPDVGTPDVGTPDTGPTCTPTTEVFNGRDDDCDGVVDEGFTTNGVEITCTANLPTLPDSDIDDGGRTGSRDGLEGFCVRGILRFCLTGEACPWRGGATTTDDLQTCSPAGLDGPSYFMAYYRTGWFYSGAGRYDEWYCPPTGRLRLALRPF